MSSSILEPVDLLDLKLLPAWVKEAGEARNYAGYTGDEQRREPRNRRVGKSERSTFHKADVRGLKRLGRHFESVRGQSRHAHRQRHHGKDRHKRDREVRTTPRPLEIGIRFLPYPPAFEKVIAQIKSGSVAYSLFALARLFLEKPQRYDVRLTAKSESPVFQLGDNGAVSLDREFLERNAFQFIHEGFYKIDVTQSDPIKGKFSNVARCRLSGILLGPTNYHNYQPQLRSLYERRFSRRMSFTDYQRQIEIVSDPALIERWKEEARTVATYTTLREETPLAFVSAAETERHFRAHYLPGLIRNVEEVTVGGVLSRRLPDRTLNRAIEDAWVGESRSPSNMMQELAARFREAGLNVFRHRRGMLFISPIRPCPFAGEHADVSRTVSAIFKAIAAKPTINRRELFEKLTANPAIEDLESRKLAVASDLRWLINEGFVMEFNDGSLDLPRVKPKSPVRAVSAANENLAVATASASGTLDELQIGGS